MFFLKQLILGNRREEAILNVVQRSIQKVTVAEFLRPCRQLAFFFKCLTSSNALTVAETAIWLFRVCHVPAAEMGRKQKDGRKGPLYNPTIVFYR